MDELIDEGITSFKLFMAYPGVFLSDDGQILQAMQTAAGNGGADHDARRERLGHRRPGAAGARARRDRAVLPRHHPALAGRAGGHPPRDHARRPHRRAALRRARVAPSRRWRRSPRPATPGRTSSARPARSTCTSRWRSSSARAQWGDFEGAKWVCSTPLRSRAEGHQDELWQVHPHQRRHDGLHRPLPVLHEGPEGAGHRRLRQDPQRHRLGRAPDGPAVPGRRRRPDHPGALGRGLLHDAGADVRPVRPQGRASPPAPTPTSSSTTRTGTLDRPRARRTT